MSGNSSLTDAGKSIGELIRDRLKSNYFGYVLTSLIVCNWQHILLIILSKREIELVLKEITSKEYVTFHYFIVPVLIGYAAAFIMPALSIPVAWVVGLISENVTHAGKWANDTVSAFNDKRLTKSLKVENEKNAQQKKLENFSKEINILNERLEDIKAQKDDFDNYLVDIYAIYKQVPKIETPEDLEKFFGLIKDSGLLDKYPVLASMVNIKYSTSKDLTESQIKDS